MSKNKKNRIRANIEEEEDIFKNSFFENSIDNLQKRIKDGEEKEELYKKKMENRDLDFIEKLYFENKLNYNEIWIEYLIKQLNDVRNKNYSDLFDSDDSDNDDLKIENLEEEEQETIENYKRLIKKLRNRLIIEEISETQKAESENESVSETSEESEELGQYFEEELDYEDMEDFLMTQKDEEKEYNKSVERIKKVMNDPTDEDYKIGMESLFLMLEKIINNKKYNKINYKWNRYYNENENIEDIEKDKLMFLTKKYDFFRDKILKNK